MIFTSCEKKRLDLVQLGLGAAGILGLSLFWVFKLSLEFWNFGRRRRHGDKMGSWELVDWQRAANPPKWELQVGPFQAGWSSSLVSAPGLEFPNFLLDCGLDVGSDVDLDQRSLV